MIVGAVAALAAEARALRPALARVPASGPQLRLERSGVGRVAATRAAERLVSCGAGALVSWGVAGALDAALRPGSLCLPRAVLDGDEALATSAAWRAAVVAALDRHALPLSEAPLLSGVAGAIATPADKRAAGAASGAVAVDMESAAVMRVARAAGLPCLVVRTIVDSAHDAIPSSIVRASRSGPVRLGPLLAGLLLAPTELAGLLRLAGRYRTALGRLEQVARILTWEVPS